MAEDFVGFDEMAKVGAAEMLAGVAVAVLVNWLRIGRILGIVEVETAAQHRRRSVPGKAGR